MVVYLLLLAVVMIGTRAGFCFWRPADNDQVWLICMVLAAAACIAVANYRRDRKPPIEQKPEPRFQSTSPYDGGIIVGGGAMASNVGLPGMVTNQGDSGGGSPGHSSCGHGGDGGGDFGGGGGQ
jgi:uncharacterized membrane protein YgcG